jgi:hypothetical protein
MNKQIQFVKDWCIRARSADGKWLTLEYLTSTDELTLRCAGKMVGYVKDPDGKYTTAQLVECFIAMQVS